MVKVHLDPMDASAALLQVRILIRTFPLLINGWLSLNFNNLLLFYTEELITNLVINHIP